MLQQGIQFLLKGGWVMWPLFACAVVSVAVMIERTITLRKAADNSDALMDEVRTLMVAGRASDALALCERTPGPVARVVAAGIRHRHLGNQAEIERAMEEAALKEIPHLNRRLGILDTVITLSPLLGLLGTITGMIQSFQVVATATGASAAPAITGGVAEALIATAAGLAVAITNLPVYNHLTDRSREIIGDIETRATQFLNILTETDHAASVAAVPSPAARARKEKAASHETAATRG